MAEGRNPSLGCGFGCVRARCGWDPFPRSNFPRRDALIDAVGRTDNPCDRPARCPPCYQKYLDRYCPCPPPEMVIQSLDFCNYPIAVEMPTERAPEDTWFLEEQQGKTNIIAGFFNPNDNKDLELELHRERCDPFYLSCGGTSGVNNLPPYPCRGVINYPRQVWTNMAEEKKLCLPEDCEGSTYLEPGYLQKQQQLRDDIKRKRELEAEEKRLDMIRRSGYKPPHPCCPEPFSQTPYCTCNDNFC